jgi:hypothetical protein
MGRKWLHEEHGMKAEGAISGNDAWAAITGWLVRAVFGTLFISVIVFAAAGTRYRLLPGLW